MEKSRGRISNLFQLLGDVLPLTNPVLGLGSCGAEQSTKVFGEVFEFAGASCGTSTLCHESSDRAMRSKRGD
jgi:hypothetical protein